jgi:hypothetical protein
MPGAQHELFKKIIAILATIDLSILSECILIGETSRIEAVERFRQAHPLALD